ncbi:MULTISPECIES: glucarate dehydratase family protein [unclassified Herbaspirillum]|jgi:glucarate dehydratase|uniref:glucarate dehydratase family protein n=1 Tax=unclassified Herbaspirillum TaxID=2624150 RepID=UPI000E2F8AAC|nr:MULTISPECIES: glucarate dehydratase family protein [unclassified Herbaspirillum]RFB73400.1 glucarate dehydratase [Herbaspirillum sp. 3R-3a1]TFI10795.1 glucarate dehydratase [Herbaspirillum sp. 3R11]TFI16702.1 glucarate dehydratase [Herbaspirillum sp. 3R-11]TFI31654.1 glucarate dehydratase [Herbaspirillum sp. 3C11]
MKITRVTVTPIAFKDAPLLNASGIHEPYALRSIIEVETDNGHFGLGESYGDAAALAVLDKVKTQLIGLDPFNLNRLRAIVKSTVAGMAPANSGGAELAPGSHASKAVSNAYSAFEVALLDAQARYLNVPLVDLLGGAVRTEIPFSAYLFFKYAEHIDSPYKPDSWGEALSEEQIVAQARRMIDENGFQSIKLKAGTLDPEHEVACIKALKKAFPDAPLRIDPNGNWSLETAVRMAELLGDDLQYYEDPTPGLEGMAELHRRTGLPLATNMVVTDFDEFRRSIPQNSVQIVLADHHYWGGLRDTQMLALMCDTFGLGVSMHSNSHLGISLMAMSHVAAAVPNLSYACDTHYPWQEADEEVIKGGKLPIRNGCVSITRAPGLGVELDRDQLAKLHDLYLGCGIRSRDDVRQMRKYKPDWKTVKPRF